MYREQNFVDLPVTVYGKAEMQSSLASVARVIIAIGTICSRTFLQPQVFPLTHSNYSSILLWFQRLPLRVPRLLPRLC